MSSQILKSPLPYLALFIAHLIWGANFVVAKVTLTEFPSMTLAFLRFALASLLIAPFIITETKKVAIDKKDLPKLILVGLLIITFNITFFFEGIVRTSAINASVLSLSVPILSVIAGWIFLKEKVNLVNVFGIFTGFLGALIIIGIPEIFLGNFTPKDMAGNIFILIASISWVIGAILSKELLEKYPSMTVTSIAFLIGTLTFFIPALDEYIKHPGWIENISLLGILGLVYMTILSSISAYFLFEWGLAKTSAGKATLFQYIEPFIAAALAITILGEKINISFLTGSVLIVLGVLLGTMNKESHHKSHKIHRI